MRTINFLIDCGAKRFPNKFASKFEGDSWTYRELADRSGALANALLKLGMTKGDRAAILSENCHRYIETIGGIAKAGMVLCTLNYMLHKDELAYILNDSGSSVLIFDRKYASVVKDLVTECKEVRNLIVFGAGSEENLHAHDYEDLISNCQPANPDYAIEEEDTLLLVYTSGTTGRPKGVMLSHKNIYCDSQYAVMGLELGHDTVNLNIAPLFHVASTVLQTMSTLHVGGTNITLRGFDPKGVLENIQKERVTFTFFVPTMIYRILDYPGVDKYDLSSLRHVTYGAAPIFVDRLKRALEIFGPVLYGVYGLTEGTANITILRKEDHVLEGPPEKLRRLNSCGREHSGHEVRIIDEEGRDVETGQVGEIIIRSEVVMKGYWNNHKGTSETVRNGWLYTGDLATFDEDHYIYVVDRKKNMIISGGENVYPKEIEETIIRHEGVREVVVIGIPHKDWGETPKAIVSPKEGVKLTEQDIIKFCRANLSRYKCPGKVFIVNELPKTSIGKIDIKRIKEEHKEEIKA